MDIYYDNEQLLFLLVWVMFWIFFFKIKTTSGANSLRLPRALLYVDKVSRWQFYLIVTLATIIHFSVVLEITPIAQSLGLVTLDTLHGFAIFLFLFGVGLAALARWDLRFMTAREVVSSISSLRINSGSYRFLRNPMYIGLTLAFTGVLLSYPTWIGAISLVLIIIIFIERSIRES